MLVSLDLHLSIDENHITAHVIGIIQGRGDPVYNSHSMALQILQFIPLTMFSMFECLVPVPSLINFQYLKK